MDFVISHSWGNERMDNVIKHGLKRALLCAALLGPATAAEAKTKSFIIDGSALIKDDGSINSTGPLMADFTDNGFRFAFTLPANYKKNSPVKIVLSGNAVDSDCDIYMIVMDVTRFRTGAGVSNAIGVLSGMKEQLFSIPPGMPTVATKTFTLNRAGAGTIRNQKAGDRVVIWLKRFAGDSRDSCTGNFTALSAKVVYKVN